MNHRPTDTVYADFDRPNIWMYFLIHEQMNTHMQPHTAISDRFLSTGANITVALAIYSLVWVNICR